VTSNMVTSLQT